MKAVNVSCVTVLLCLFVQDVFSLMSAAFCLVERFTQCGPPLGFLVNLR